MGVGIEMSGKWEWNEILDWKWKWNGNGNRDVGKVGMGMRYWTGNKNRDVGKMGMGMRYWTGNGNGVGMGIEMSGK